ncbi:MAG: AI-2E family transporter [Planctomycetaceae bacterium]|nr:AI-2E family transporter [Planctomycetaceae bacterium]
MSTETSGTNPSDVPAAVTPNRERMRETADRAPKVKSGGWLQAPRPATVVPSRSKADSEPTVSPDEVDIPSLPEPRAAAPESRYALNVLASLAVLHTAYLAAGVLLPLMYSLVIWLTLRPVVRSLARRRIPQGVSAAGLIFLLVALVLSIGLSLAQPAREWIESAPATLAEAGERLSVVRDRIRQFRDASEKLEDIAAGREPVPKEKPSTISRVLSALNGEEETEQLAGEKDEPVQVEVSQPALTSNLAMLSSAGALAASVFASFVMAFFLLSSGDVLLNNVLRILPSFKKKRVTVELVHSIERGISFYLLNVTMINAGLGLAIGLAMWGLGMPNPALWGMMAALFNFLPFLGAMAGTVIVFIVALITFDSLSWAALVPTVYFGLTAIEGNLITPGLLGRSMSLNPIMVFLSLVIWGWMWGVGGVLLAVPILAIIRVSCDHFERLQPVATLLGSDRW